MSSPKKQSDPSPKLNPTLARTIRNLTKLQAAAEKVSVRRGRKKDQLLTKLAPLQAKVQKLANELATLDAVPNQEQLHFEATFDLVNKTPAAYGIHTPKDRAAFDANFL